MRQNQPIIDIQTLRSQIRRQRRQLSHTQLRHAAQQITHTFFSLPQLRKAQRIGLYLDAFGEVPTWQIIRRLFQQKKQVFLPVICPMTQQLRWQRISMQQWRNRRFAMHRLGMQQPMQQSTLAISSLDTLVLPLVVFDHLGHRVGMGGGYYDRTLAQHPQRPYRIGLAHDFQHSKTTLTMQPWDQKLNAICTPTRYLLF